MRYTFILSIAFSLLFLQSCMKGEAVDTIIHNAKVHTMDEMNTVFEAVAIKDGKIVEVGAERQIMNRYSAEEYIDAEMKDVYPGFTDAHGHILSYAKGKLGVDLFGCKSYDELIIRIEKYQGKYKRKFIVGAGWDQSLWGEADLPDNKLLSEKFPDIPVCLFRIDGHAVLVNDYLLEKSDVINKVDNDPRLNKGGYYALDFLEGEFTPVTSQGGGLLMPEPSGVLVDNAMNPVLEMIPDYPENEMREAILEIQSELLAYGITGVHEAGMQQDEVQLFDRMVNSGELKLNIYGMLLPTEENFDFARKQGIYRNNNFLIRSFKVFGDGALGSRGAFLKHAYADHQGHHGYLVTQIDEIQKVAEIAEEVDYQMNVHAIGDSTNRLMLELYQDIFSVKPDHRWRIEHAQVVDPNDFHLFAEAGVFPSIQPTHAVTDQRWAEDRLGKENMKGAYAYNSLLQQFGMVAIGTDFPVEYPDPFRTIHAAINRKNTENQPKGGFLAEERISLQDCLNGMTKWAAIAAFQENELGTIEKGKDATLVIFDKPVEAYTYYQPNFAYITFIRGKKVYSVQ